VDIHPWDAATGTLGPPVARSPRRWRAGGIEDVTWLASGDRLLVTDQFRDQALVVNCDPTTGTLGPVRARIGWAAGGLHAPHGCAQSPDGRWLAITNYGDGSLRIFDTADPAAAGAASTT
jgi:DNA-binding beta-propeller fold protein YncE